MKEQPLLVDDKRTGMKVDDLKRAIIEHPRYVVGEDQESASEMDYFMAIASRCGTASWSGGLLEEDTSRA